MQKTRVGSREHHRPSISYKTSRGVLGSAMRFGAIPIHVLSHTDHLLKKYGRGGLNMVGEAGNDLFDITGTTTDSAAGLLTSPFKRLIRRGPKKTKHKRTKHKRTKHKRTKHKKHKKHTKYKKHKKHKKHKRRTRRRRH